MFWIFKCNSLQRPYQVASGDWNDFFGRADEQRWGTTKYVPALSEVRRGDTILAYQTDRNELVGLAKVTALRPRGRYLDLILRPMKKIGVKVRPLKESDRKIAAIPALQPGPIQTLYVISPPDASRLLRAACVHVKTERHVDRVSNSKAHMPPELVGIRWTDPESTGYMDLLQAELFANEGTVEEITHAVLGPHGGLYQARCRLIVQDTTADLDYEAFPDFNKRWGMLLGLLRLHFLDGKRDRLIRVQWRYKGRKRFSPTATANIDPDPLPQLKPYKRETRAGKYVTREVRERPGQIRFRCKLMMAYGGKCCISGCSVSDALDGAHIDPFSGASSDHPQNGLLLRQDLHSLFDANLLAVHPDTRIVHLAARTLVWPEYAALNETAQLADPKAGGDSYKPSHEALKRRWRRFNRDT